MKYDLPMHVLLHRNRGEGNWTSRHVSIVAVRKRPYDAHELGPDHLAVEVNLSFDLRLFDPPPIPSVEVAVQAPEEPGEGVTARGEVVV